MSVRGKPVLSSVSVPVADYRNYDAWLRSERYKQLVRNKKGIKNESAKVQ